ncbi:MAG: 3-hydroxyisobutyrate dehydrogenase [Ramlibacter sp.]|nr:3-hydroxyisobutyrate dehydrogenase [Ramlibacter sp.]
MGGRNQVGFVGLGHMGGPMATSLAKAGMKPLVYDVRPEAGKQQEAHGARAAASLADVVAQCDIIGTCVLYEHQVRDTFLGPSGIVTLGRRGQVALIHSTLPPGTVREIAAAAAEKGIGIIDAPVSGGDTTTKEGTLTIMVGAEDWAWDKAEAMLQTMGRDVIRVGKPGDGQIVKLGNNIMSLCNQAVHMEAIRFVKALGVSQEALDRVATACTGGSWAVSNYDHFDRYATEHTLAGTPELSHKLGKDLRVAVSVAQEQWTYLPIVALCSQLLPDLFDQRWAENKKQGK